MASIHVPITSRRIRNGKRARLSLSSLFQPLERCTVVAGFPSPLTLRTNGTEGRKKDEKGEQRDGWKREIESWSTKRIARENSQLFYFCREPAAFSGESQIERSVLGARFVADLRRSWWVGAPSSGGCRRLNNRRAFYLTRKITRIPPSFPFADRFELPRELWYGDLALNEYHWNWIDLFEKSIN